MKIFTFLRIHANIHYAKTNTVASGAGDDDINNITEKYPGSMIHIEPIFDEKTGIIMDTVYVYVPDENDLGNDGNGDSGDDDPIDNGPGGNFAQPSLFDFVVNGRHNN